ncbi:MAG: hydrogenase maturation nickel metallochaperone HypA [Myxococcales bacterium]|nr:hydrogenase maturation nickel metallochaperone HypA [Myxococcales bacterium]
MHELAIGSAIVDTATRHAAGRPVRRVHLRVGALRQVVPDSLSFYFEFCARGTSCEGAQLELECVATRLHCEHCCEAWEPDGVAFRCPGCRAAPSQVLAGEELEIDSIIVEEEAEPCRRT